MKSATHSSIHACLFFVCATTLAAQAAPPVQRIDKPTGRSADGFTDVVGVVELADGSIIAADLRERRIVRIAFPSGQVQAVSREGPGPNEYTGTFSIFRWLGDTVLVYGRRDFLKISPSGAPAGKMALFADALPGRGTGVPWFSDGDGTIYWEAPEPLRRRTDNDSFHPIMHATVVRWNPRSNRSDTLGSLQQRDPKGPFVSYWRPYPAKDAFAALPNGSVMFFRASNYNVEVVGRDGKRVGGSNVAYRATPIGADERDAFRDDIIRRPRGGASLQGPAGVPAKGAEREQARRNTGVPDAAFPATMPPFAEERAALVDRSHRVWLRRSYRGSEEDRTYDVFDAQAKLVGRVSVPDRGRVVGFGRTSIYVVRLDDDEMEWIERHSMPALSGGR